MVINEILLYFGSLIITIWGIGHIMPVRSVVNGFEPTSNDNKLIIAMEWIAEGLNLCFIGILVLIITLLEDYQNSVSILVYQLSGLILIIMAVLHLLTGARTSVIPLKICPVILISSAILFVLGSAL